MHALLVELTSAYSLVAGPVAPYIARRVSKIRGNMALAALLRLAALASLLHITSRFACCSCNAYT